MPADRYWSDRAQATAATGRAMGTQHTIQDVVTSGTITLPNPNEGDRIRVKASAGAATSVILQKGVFDGQEISILNVDASNDITMAASGTSNVANGTGAVITHLTHKRFIYSTLTSLWY